MSNFINSVNSIGLLDDMARQKSYIHRLHPLTKLSATLAYLIIVVSFNRYEVIGLFPLSLYPIILLTLADIPAKFILKRLLFIEPFIIGIGILNPLLDHHIINVAGFTLSRGWVTFISIFIKSGLTITAAILLVATTGMDKLAYALRTLKIPRLFVLQLMLTYRYISVLMEELSQILTAYSLRAPNQKGVSHKAWGSLVGQLILRTFDRAYRVYEAMRLRGFTGEYNNGNGASFKINDLIYLTICVLFFVIARAYNIPMIIGSLIMGVGV